MPKLLTRLAYVATTLLLVGLLQLTTVEPASACQLPDRHQCDPVPENTFGHGTREDTPDHQVELCLPAEILRAITRNDGTYEWTLRLMTMNSDGSVRWQTAHVVQNQPCRSQGVFSGTLAAVYVTCDEYTGWITTGRINRSGQPGFSYVQWSLDYRILDQRWPT